LEFKGYDRPSGLPPLFLPCFEFDFSHPFWKVPTAIPMWNLPLGATLAFFASLYLFLALPLIPDPKALLWWHQFVLFSRFPVPQMVVLFRNSLVFLDSPTRSPFLDTHELWLIGCAYREPIDSALLLSSCLVPLFSPPRSFPDRKVRTVSYADLHRCLSLYLIIFFFRCVFLPLSISIFSVIVMPLGPRIAF